MRKGGCKLEIWRILLGISGQLRQVFIKLVRRRRLGMSIAIYPVGWERTGFKGVSLLWSDSCDQMGQSKPCFIGG